MSREAMKLALEALDHNMLFTSDKPGHDCLIIERAYDALLKELAEQPAQQCRRELSADGSFVCDCKPAQQEPVGPEPFGYFQYDIRLDAWVQNRINNKGAAFYTAGDIQALKHRIHDQDAMLERQTARIVDLQTHIENLEGEQT